MGAGRDPRASGPDSWTARRSTNQDFTVGTVRVWAQTKPQGRGEGPRPRSWSSEAGRQSVTASRGGCPGALLLRACSPHPGGEWGAARSLDPPSSHLLSGGEGVFPPRPHPHPVTGPNRSPEPACTASRLPQGQQCSTSVIKHGLCKPTTCLVSERSQGRPRTCPPSRGTALRHGVRSGGPFRRRCRSSRDAV